jgi:hypothetical protein
MENPIDMGEKLENLHLCMKNSLKAVSKKRSDFAASNFTSFSETEIVIFAIKRRRTANWHHQNFN